LQAGSGEIAHCFGAIGITTSPSIAIYKLWLDNGSEMPAKWALTLPAQPCHFGGAQAMAERHEDHGSVAVPLAVVGSGLYKPLDLGLGQVFPRPALGTLNNATAGTDEAVYKGLLGWTAGGGVAYAFAQNWNASTSSLPFSQLTTETTTNVRAVEFGVNYKFNSSASPSTTTPTLYPKQLAAALDKSPHASYGYDWTGVYLGSDGGYGRSTPKGTLTEAGVAPLAPYNYGVTGPLAGRLSAATISSTNGSSVRKAIGSGRI
jgi:hypothetical protein